MKIAQHQFDGELLTVNEIQRRVPRLAVYEIRRHLAAGRNTKTQMLAYDPTKMKADSGRKTAIRNAEKRKTYPQFGRTKHLCLA